MSFVTINLFLGVTWLVLGGFFFLYEPMTGESLPYRLPMGRLNPGWLAILFAAFNFYRALLGWSHRRRRQRQAAEEEYHRRFERRSRKHRPEGPPDPNFIFTDEPAIGPEGDATPFRAADGNRLAPPGSPPA